MITERTIRILEYDKIIRELSSLAATQPGKDRCLALMPSDDYEEVLFRQRTTDDAVRIVLEKSLPPLSGLVEIRPILTRARLQASLSCRDLLDVAQFLRAAARLRGFLPASEDWFADNIVCQTMKRIQPVPALENAIAAAIAGEEELYDSASPALAAIRRKIRDTQAEVKTHLERIVRGNSKSLQEQLVTLRENRYVVPVRADHRADIPGIIHDTSSSGATLFVEPYPVVEANNRIREYFSQERDEIERILLELSARVCDYEGTLQEDAEIAETVDFYFAKARHAIQCQAMPPVVNTDGKLRLLSARHPLIPKDRVVPVTIEVGFGFDTLVITGPNTGGKTVSLKTCGLFCLMAMAGLQIPAKEHSQVSIFRTIVADIGDEQSIEQNLSTFSSHMSNLVKIIAGAGPSSLVLLDELGAGTDPSEGAALAISILEHLQKSQCKVIATTHYKELKVFAIHTPRVENACCEFDVETLRPTYKLLIGIPGVSNAFNISSRLGLPDAIIGRARELLSSEEVEFEKVIEETEKARKAALQMEDSARELKNGAIKEIEEVKAARKELEARKKDILLKAREEAKEYVEEAYEEAQLIIDEMKKAIQEQNAADTRKRLDDARAMLKMRKTQLENEIGKTTLDSYRKSEETFKAVLGESYYTSALGISGMLVEFADAKGNCVLLHGNKRVTVPIASLRPAEGGDGAVAGTSSRQRTVGIKRAASGMTMSKKMTMGTEIKLIGLTVEEACERLDKFIDDAVLTGVQTIRIVHGKGTGALRSAINQQLKRDKRVHSFRLGDYGEGDSGVTIAQL